MKHLLSLLALGATAATSFGASIGINFGSGRADAALAATDSAGVVAQTNWNNAAGATGSLAALNDDAGGASGASIAWATDEQWSVGGTPADGNGTLLNGFISENNNASASTVTLSTIPYASYDLYVYLSHDRNFEDVILGETGGAFGPFTAVENNTPITAAVTFVEQTTSATTAGNYVLFSGLTGSSLSMTMGAVDANFSGGGTAERNAIAGLQIVQVPEPSTGVLGLLTLAGMALRRRR